MTGHESSSNVNEGMVIAPGPNGRDHIGHGPWNRHCFTNAFISQQRLHSEDMHLRVVAKAIQAMHSGRRGVFDLSSLCIWVGVLEVLRNPTPGIHLVISAKVDIPSGMIVHL